LFVFVNPTLISGCSHHHHYPQISKVKEKIQPRSRSSRFGAQFNLRTFQEPLSVIQRLTLAVTPPKIVNLGDHQISIIFAPSHPRERVQQDSRVCNPPDYSRVFRQTTFSLILETTKNSAATTFTAWRTSRTFKETSTNRYAPIAAA
jgi:hypothetical protein